MKSAINRVLVTGGAGFIGSHLCERLLAGGMEVVSYDNFCDFYDPNIKRDNIREILNSPDAKRFVSVEGDIRDKSLLLQILQSRKIEAVIHLAALAGVRPSIEHPALYTDVNIGGTQALLDACVATSIRRVVFASSSSVYGNNCKVPFSEADSVDSPVSPYAATKKAGELICYTYAHLFALNIACLRFFTVYGPRQRPDLAVHKFSQCISKGMEVPFFGDGTTSRDYTYINDIVEGVMRALEWSTVSPGGSCEIFNLGESRTVSLSYMLMILEKVLEKKAHLKRLPMQRGDVVCTFADISKARRILGYNPQTSFEDGVEAFVSWFKNRELVAVA